MTLKNIPATSKRQEDEKNLYILKLERYNQNLLKLRQKLCSYVCEPTTYTLYERIEMLRNKLEAMRDSNTQLILKLKKDSSIVYDTLLKAEENFVNFNDLSRNVEEYVNKARPC